MIWVAFVLFLVITLGDSWPVFIMAIFVMIAIFIALVIKASRKQHVSNSDLHSDSSMPEYKTKDQLFAPPNIAGQIRYHQYKVRGRNPATNRMKTCVVVAPEGTSELEICTLSGFVEPYTISFDTSSFTEVKPSEKQLNYAKDLNISIPSNCTFADLSSLISMQTGECSKTLRNNAQAEFAAKHNICLSPYCSYESAIRRTLAGLKKDSILYYFVYLVYCFTRSKTVGNPDDSIHSHVFQSFSYDKETAFNIVILRDYEQTNRLINGDRIDRRHKRFVNLYDQICLFLADNNV